VTAGGDPKLAPPPSGLIAKAIARPVTVLVGVLLLTLFGLLSLIGVPIQLTPDVIVPTLSVTTAWPGAAPTEVEAEVLKPQEDVLKNLPNLQTMTSEARTGQGTITLELRVGASIEDALVRVSNSLSQVPSYPQDVRKPVLSSANATGPPMMVAVLQSLTGKQMAPYRTWVEQEVLPVLERQQGVGRIWLIGGQDREVEVLFSPHALAARKIPLSKLASVVRGELRDVSAGDLEMGKRRMLVRTPLAARTPKQLERLVLQTDNEGRAVYLGDVARARYGLRKPGALAFSDGRPSLALLIFREPGSNVLDVTQRLRGAIKRLEETRIGPEGLELRIVSDQVGYIKGALELMQVNLGLGAVLAMLVLLLFLRSVRAAALISLAIPICVVGTALGMALLGRTVNIVSLAGVAFAVGMVVDNSIVVLESIYTRYRDGEPAKTAALEGTREVWGAIVASTATTAVVFIPIIGWQDEVGELLRDVAIALSVAVFVSLIVSVFVISAFAGRALRAVQQQTKEDAPESSGGRIRAVLGRSARWISGSPMRSIAVIVLSFALAASAVRALLPPLEYLPTGNRNLAFGIMVPPPGTSVEELAKVGKGVQRSLMAHTNVERDGVPALARFFYVARPEQVFMGAVAKDPRRMPGVMRFLKKVQGRVAGVYRIVVRASLFGRRLGGGRAIEVDISGQNLPELIAAGRVLIGSLARDLPGAQLRPIPSLDLGAPELRVIPKRKQLARVGMQAAELALAVDALVDGAIVGEISQPGQPRLDVVLRARTALLRSPEALAAAPVATPSGQVVPLGTLATVKETLGPTVLRRLERRRTITLQVTPPTDIALEAALARVQRRVETLRRSGALARGVRIGFSGSAGSLQSAKSRFGWVLLLAVVISLLLMAAIFEDFLAPIAILVTLPFAAAGGVLGLLAVDRFLGSQPLDMMTALGFLILIGVVVNNAILVVDGALRRLAEGMPLESAVGAAVERRVRPILMSTLTSLAGLMPLVVARGFGSELYRGVGAIVLGGLAVATLLTLFVVPAAFSLLWRLRAQVSRR
jgi:HAE1 family hydrophobic/amphiphilic exporter-1